MYAALVFYNASKQIVRVYSKADLGEKTAGISVTDYYVPYSSEYKYVRWQAENTIDPITYTECADDSALSVTFYELPKILGDKDSVLSSNGDGTTFWKSMPDSILSNNYGKTIGIIGGSFATEANAKIVYDMLREKLGMTVNSAAIGGAGFCQGTTFVQQSANFASCDIYVIWCSTNDFTNNKAIGNSSDAAGANTQWGAFKQVLANLYASNPNAKICLWSSSPHLTSKQGNEEGIGSTTNYTNNLREYVDAQQEMCAMYSIPYLDQYYQSGQNSFNKSLVCKSNDFHLTDFGYQLLANKQLLMLSEV